MKTNKLISKAATEAAEEVANGGLDMDYFSCVQLEKRFRFLQKPQHKRTVRKYAALFCPQKGYEDYFFWLNQPFCTLFASEKESHEWRTTARALFAAMQDDD